MNTSFTNNLAWYLFLGIMVWIIVACYWYVCGIKGFCSMGSSTAVNVEDRRDTVLTEVASNENTRVIREEVTTITEEIVIECDSHLDSYIRYGYNNQTQDVRRLEEFLQTYEQMDVKVDGVFSRSDEQAVKEFQEKYSAEILEPWGIEEASGFVFQTTRDHINALYCAYQYAEQN